MAVRIIIFLVINFAALGIGGLFTGQGVSSEWYAGLNKAPWTPPGWVFGAAWTTIMVCLAVYMSYLWPNAENRKLLIGLFSVQWLLNVLWNPVFFYAQQISVGLAVITTLTLIVGVMQFHYASELGWKSLLITPYLVWLLIATSLNGYILFNN